MGIKIKTSKNPSLAQNGIWSVLTSAGQRKWIGVMFSLSGSFTLVSSSTVHSTHFFGFLHDVALPVAHSCFLLLDSTWHCQYFFIFTNVIGILSWFNVYFLDGKCYLTCFPIYAYFLSVYLNNIYYAYYICYIFNIYLYINYVNITIMY